jgi:hypothetical protein
MAENWGDDLIEEDFVFAHVTSDQFGVPSNIMGRHNEEFFSLLGRIVALAAILEYKILVFYQYLVGRRQDVFTELTVAKLIARAQEDLHRLNAPEDYQLAEVQAPGSENRRQPGRVIVPLLDSSRHVHLAVRGRVPLPL